MTPFSPPLMPATGPLYPVHLQLLRVTGTTVPGPSGVAQVAGSSFLAPPLYVAFVQQLVPDTLIPRDREPCLAADVMGLGIGIAPVGSQGRFFLGRLAGTWTSLPVYEIVAVAASTPTTVFSGAKVYMNSDTPLNPSANLACDIELYDTDGFHSTTVNNHRFTIPTTGYYRIGAFAIIQPHGTAYGGLVIRTSIAENVIGVSDTYYVYTPGHKHSLVPCWGDIRLSVGDYVWCEVGQDSGVSADMIGGLGFNAFWIHKIG